MDSQAYKEITMDMTFNEERLDNLKIAYDRAVDADKEDFWFEDAHFLVTYAKYVIEYLEQIHH